MSANSQTIKARITVWQPYFAGTMLAYGRSDDSNLQLLEHDAELQREILTWPVMEDVWGGVADTAIRTGLEDRFRNAFQPMKLPGERSMSAFGEFVDDLRAVAESGGSEWSTTETETPDSGAVMLNALLAFCHQLSWLHDVYRDVPGASVSVR